MKKSLDVVFAGVEAAVKALLLFMVVLISIQVLLRGTTGRSIKWAEEAALIAMVWVTFLTLAIGVRLDIHIRIDMFVGWLPRRGRIILEFALDLILCFISAMMIYYGWRLSAIAMRSTMPASRLPTGVVYAIVPLTGVLCLAEILSRLLGAPRSAAARNFIEGIPYDDNKAAGFGEGSE
ncbi:MAG: TRAP transporter small permease [Planctomycetota bacterium]|jgi:TRAP-type C4-dicarboxylate transport system permease small subunit|nr:TRAP transporter small permease [Planctomycetota bacterium]